MRRVRLRLIKLRDKLVSRDILLALVITIALIAIAVFISWYNNKVVPVSPAANAHYNLEPHNFLSFMSNWDGPNYLNIARHGYSSIILANFLPLYPLMIYLVNLVLGSLLDSALLIAWASLVGAIYFYIKIVKHIFKISNNQDALRALIYFILFPTAIFLMATYTEGLFACLALAAIYFALNDRYLLTAGFALLCTATHITGVFVLVFVAMILLEQGLNKAKVLLTFMVGSLGLVSYAYFLWDKFRRPLAFITSQENHGWLKYGEANLINTIDPFNVLFMALLLASVVYWWRRRKSFSIYSLLFLLIPLIGKQFGGFNRYVLMAFPLQLMLYGYLRNKKVAYIFVIALLTIFWTYFTLQYAGGYVGG